MKCLHGNGWCDYFDLMMTDNCAKGDPPDVENCQLHKNRQTSEAVVPLNDLLSVCRDGEDFIQNRFGYCFYTIDQTCLIYNLYTHQEYRNCGRAKRILRLVINEIRETGYSGKIGIEAKPKEANVNLDGLLKLYKNMGLEPR